MELYMHVFGVKGERVEADLALMFCVPSRVDR